MKWNNNGIKYERGNYECLIARYNDTGYWVCVRADATQQTQKSNFKDLGEFLSASKCEVKHLYDVDDELTETNIILIDNLKAYGGGFAFWKTNGIRREKINPNELHKYLPVPAR